MKNTTDDFIRKSKNIHQNRYDYSLTNYLDCKTHVIIICKEHGEFKQRPNDHLNGHGCKKCQETRKDTNKTFIKKAIIIHGNKYDYSQVNYIKSREKVKIICPIHGIFEQKPAEHLTGYGCQKCGIEKTTLNTIKPKNGESLFDKFPNLCLEWSNKNKKTPKDFKYGSKQKIIWVCLNCKEEWIQTIVNRTNNESGCPKCRNFSKGEKSVETYLQENNIKYQRQYIDKNCKYKRPLRFDFAIWINNKLLLIEYNGRQHYLNHKKGYHSSELNLEIIQKRDKIKVDFCKENNIPLLIIHFKDYKKISELIDEFIKKYV